MVARLRIHLLLYVIGLAVFGGVAGARLLHQSSDPHFVYQAQAWLSGRLAIEPPPERGDDWAIQETVELDDGTQVRGRRLTTRPRFATTTGEEIDVRRIRRRVSRTHYVSFPPAPALLMLPSAAISGRRGNDVIPTVLIAALVLPLAFATLRRLAEAQLSKRSIADDVWLALAFGFGTVFFFCAVQGRVWFTAHVVGAAAIWGYLWASIGARNAMIAGLCLALATLSRAPLAFCGAVFLFEAWHRGRGDLRALLSLAARFAVPLLVLGLLAMWMNAARWDSVTEFGHRYLAVRQQADIETHGLFDWHYLRRNLEVAFLLLPELSSQPPYLRINGHGLALWLTSPIIFWALWPTRPTRLHLPLWLTVLVVAVPTLFYQNTGWFQFGYRFGVDYLPFVVCLVALSKAELGRIAKAAIIVGIVINAFGAVTFARHHGFYRADAAAYGSIVTKR